MFSLLRRGSTAAHRTPHNLRAYTSSPTPPLTVAGLCPSDPRPQMIFMAGLPGSGKTTAIKKLYGLDNVELLDIDVEMIEHPAYNVDDRAAVYALPGAYEWADRKVGERLRCILGAVSPPPLVVLDGTGTKVARRVMRMNEARSAGFRTTLLYVKVGLATALQRNSGRKRVVPEDVMVGYLAKLERRPMREPWMRSSGRQEERAAGVEGDVAAAGGESEARGRLLPMEAMPKVRRDDHFSSNLTLKHRCTATAKRHRETASAF